MGKNKKPGKTSGKTVIGTIRINFKGKGFVRTKTEKEDIEIEFKNLGTALNGDTVKTLVKPRGQSKVIEIIKRAKRGFAGELVKEGGAFYLKPSDLKMYVEVALAEKDLSGATPGDKIFVTLGKWTPGKNLVRGEVQKVLGRAGDHEAEMQGIILERGFDATFPPEILREAEKLKHQNLSPAEIKKRRDMRRVTTFTIDPEDAKDFDDALSIRELEVGSKRLEDEKWDVGSSAAFGRGQKRPDEKSPGRRWEIGIHIADVSFYVRPNTALDKEAFERATSVYLVDRTIPMLPEVLSNDLCSLNPNEDKLCFSAIFEMNEKGEVLKEWFGRTVIHSDKRFSYEEAQKVLDTKSGPFFTELETLNKIAKHLTEKRVRDGAIVMETEEIKFKLDAEGKPVSVYIKERGDTNKLIEEFMLLANRRVAMYGSKDDKRKDRVFMYRIHDEPDKDKIKDLKEYLKLLGYSLNERRGIVPPQEFNRLFAELEGKNEKETVQSVVIRSMQKAIYSTKNLGHYGLAFPFYTHFTSPIRRYPDVITHRLLADYLAGRSIPKERAGYFQKVAEHSTAREIEAAEAERASIKYKQLEYIAEHRDEEFTGSVVGMTEWGLYVAESKTHAEGMVKLRDIEGDDFKYDVKNFAARGEKTGKMIRIGDEVKMVVENVDLERQTIDYRLVSLK